MKHHKLNIAKIKSTISLEILWEILLPSNHLLEHLWKSQQCAVRRQNATFRCWFFSTILRDKRPHLLQLYFKSQLNISFHDNEHWKQLKIKARNKEIYINGNVLATHFRLASLSLVWLISLDLEWSQSSSCFLLGKYPNSEVSSLLCLDFIFLICSSLSVYNENIK